MARSITKSVGKAGINLYQDVRTVQELLNAHMTRLSPLRALVTDGKVGPMTIGAIEEFQRRVVGMRFPDGRVDPNGQTLQALNQVSACPTPPSPPATTGTFRVVFQHRGVVPEMSNAKGTEKLYESSVSILGPATGQFRGSIFPDDLSVKGRIQDGTYDLYLGFHKRDGQKPTANDLVARDNGFRAALIVQNDGTVPVLSNNPSKTTSSSIHVHNGYNSKRYSEGCQTLHPQDWPGFIGLFLKCFPALSDWQSTSTYVGKKIGVLEVRT
ncbi:MAG: peptidoglycan-binding protein [Pirellulaceae bacterium]